MTESNTNAAASATHAESAQGPGTPGVRGLAPVIEALNGQLTNELTAVNQYFLHSRIFGHWELRRLEKKEYQESIGEMKHADLLIKRILLLGGLPNVQALHKVRVGENTEEILKCDYALESSAHKHVVESMALCERLRDFVSRDLLLTILDDTEEHVDWLHAQFELIGRVGLQNYQQSMMGEAGE